MYSLFCYTAFLSIKTNIVTALYPPQMSVRNTQYILKSLSVSWTLLIFLAPLCSLVVFSMVVSTSSAEVYISFHYHWLFFEIQLIHHEFTHFKYKIQSFFLFIQTCEVSTQFNSPKYQKFQFIYLWLLVLLMPYVRNYYRSQCHKKLPMFLSETFTVLGLTFSLWSI